jgi:hypothetical protein
MEDEPTTEWPKVKGQKDRNLKIEQRELTKKTGG